MVDDDSVRMDYRDRMWFLAGGGYIALAAEIIEFKDNTTLI